MIWMQSISMHIIWMCCDRTENANNLKSNIAASLKQPSKMVTLLMFSVDENVVRSFISKCKQFPGCLIVWCTRCRAILCMCCSCNTGKWLHCVPCVSFIVSHRDSLLRFFFIFFQSYQSSLYECVLGLHRFVLFFRWVCPGCICLFMFEFCYHRSFVRSGKNTLETVAMQNNVCTTFAPKLTFNCIQM